MTATTTNTIWDQISTETKMACGARQPVADGSDYLHFQVGGSALRKIVVKLNGLDLYDVELVNINRRTCEVKTMRSVQNVDAANLSETIYRMVNR